MRRLPRYHWHRGILFRIFHWYHKKRFCKVANPRYIWWRRSFLLCIFLWQYNFHRENLFFERCFNILLESRGLIRNPRSSGIGYIVKEKKFGRKNSCNWLFEDLVGIQRNHHVVNPLGFITLVYYLFLECHYVNKYIKEKTVYRIRYHNKYDMYEVCKSMIYINRAGCRISFLPAGNADRTNIPSRHSLRSETAD
jgi:hypothetical protein